MCDALSRAHWYLYLKSREIKSKYFELYLTISPLKEDVEIIKEFKQLPISNEDHYHWYD